MPDNSLPIDAESLWKTLVITLFILSMINERITNFIKLNIQGLLTKLVGQARYSSLFNHKPNFKTPESDPAKEKEREGGITNFSILCGFLVAALCGADLIYMFSHQGNLLEDKDILELPLKEIIGVFSEHFLGFILTAFFISLGSKFWHDLLDLLLYTSNLKRKLSTRDPLVFDADSADQVKEAAELTDRQLVDMALRDYKASLPGQALPANVVYTGRGRKIIQGRLQTVVIFYLRDSNRSTVPSRIQTTLKSGRKVDVATYVVVNVDAVPHVHFNPGLTVQNGRGSICCLLTNQDDPTSLYALTCSHVLTDGSRIDLAGDLTGPMTELVRICRRVNGEWVYGLMDSAFDIALVRADNTQLDFEYSFVPNLKTLPAPSNLQQRRVVLHSQQSDPIEGFVLSVNESVDMQYTNTTTTLDNLLEIGTTLDDQSAQAISIGGDSGALVYDADTNEPIGMVVGGNTRFTYVIPLSSILQRADFINYQIHSPS